jgi:nucleoid DNA-binding protein
MADAMSLIVSEVKSNRFTSISALSDEDVAHVWEAVSQFVERQMGMQKGVQIPGLGVFTFCQTKLDVGNNKYILIQRPVFQLSEKFAQTHHVEHVKHHVSGHIPILPLNYTVLSMESPFDRDQVERCVKEVLQAFSRTVQKNGNVEFTFAGIGRLSIRDSKAKMKFFKDFITSMDSSGILMDAFLKKGRTSKSALSIVTGNTPRPASDSTALFPRIVSSAGANGTGSPAMDGSPAARAVVETRHSRRSSQEAMPVIPEGAVVSQHNSSASEDEDISRYKLSPVPADVAISQSNPLECARQPCSSPKPERKPTPRSSRSRFSSTPAPNFRPSNCSHGPQTGQELCYLCHQREARNIPVSFAEERRARELYEDRLLQHYQQQRDSLAIAREQARDARYRDLNCKVAKLNFEAAEKRKQQMLRRPSSDREFDVGVFITCAVTCLYLW